MSGMAVDNSGNIYVGDGSGRRVIKFDSMGNYLLEWGDDGRIGNDFNDIIDLAVDNYGNIYISEDNGRIIKFKCYGKYIREWKEPDALGSIATDAAGNLFISHRCRDQIVKYSPHGELLHKWGSKGIKGWLDKAEGQFRFPLGVAVDNANRVYVVDSSNARIQIFSTSGSFLWEWGKRGNETGQFFRPGRITVDFSGNVYVGDQSNRIQKFKLNFHSNRVESITILSRPNQINGLTVDSKESVYVYDVIQQKITKFNQNGILCSEWSLDRTV